MSDAVQEMLIDSHLKVLGLPAMQREYRPLAREAETTGKSHLAFLAALLEEEVRSRQERRLSRRLKEASFPVLKSLEQFDFGAVPDLPRPRILSLLRSDFVSAKENVIFLGSPGTGKTHLAIALAAAAITAGYRVRFTNASALTNDLLAAQSENRLNRFLKSWSRVDLAVVDELGYVPFSENGARLLFQFFADRYERKSTIVTSNLEFSRWPEVFRDETMTAALVDRLTHRAQVFVINGQSYRLRESLRRQEVEQQMPGS